MELVQLLYDCDPKNSDFCKFCLKYTLDYGTPNGNIYCCECRHMKG